MLMSVKHDQDSLILRLFIVDSSVSTGAGLTGLTHSSTGLIISTIADSEAAATAYTVAASNVETITTLGTYAAPTASKCRFKEVDSTNHPGVYEIQLADARFAVSGAKNLIVSVHGATNTAPVHASVRLTSVDPDDATRGGMTALPNANAEASGGLYTRGTGAGQINQDSNGRVDINLVAIEGSSTKAAGIGSAGDEYNNNSYFPANLTAVNGTGSDATGLGSLGSEYNSNSYVTANFTYINGNTDPVSGLESAGSEYFNNSYFNANVTHWSSSGVSNGSTSGFPIVDAQAISDSTTAADNVEANIAKLDADISTRATPAQVNTECDTALSDYDAPTKSEMDSAFTEIKGSTWSSTTDTLEAIGTEATLLGLPGVVETLHHRIRRQSSIT